jgi:hypothetical protein
MFSGIGIWYWIVPSRMCQGQIRGMGSRICQDRHRRERLKTLRQRAAERRAREGLPPLETNEPKREDVIGLSIGEVLQRGRARAFATPGTNMPSRNLTKRLERLEAEPAPPSDKTGVDDRRHQFWQARPDYRSARD